MAVFQPRFKDPKTEAVRKSRVWWYKFTWRGELVRESTKQTNKRVAEQMQAARRAALAKGEVGIRDRRPVPTLREFATNQFFPYVEATFTAKPKTVSYYDHGVKALLRNQKLAEARLDAITGADISAFAGIQRQAGLQISTINRQLQVLRRMFHLAMEWATTEKALPKVRMLPGETRRERVLSDEEEKRYFAAAQAVGDQIVGAHQRALHGIRATQRGESPQQPRDPFVLRDIALTLLDCGLRPEECFRLRRENVHDGILEVHFGKTANARRRIPMSRRVALMMSRRMDCLESEWIFPAPTESGHAEPSTIKDHHAKAVGLAQLEPFVLYTLRHTCLTRWAACMDPYTLAFLAGHSDFATTRRYVHPQDDTVLAAIERAQEAKGSTRIGQSKPEILYDVTAGTTANALDFDDLGGAPGVIRTPDLLVRSQTLYPAELRARKWWIDGACAPDSSMVSDLVFWSRCTAFAAVRNEVPDALVDEVGGELHHHVERSGAQRQLDAASQNEADGGGGHGAKQAVTRCFGDASAV